jgi:hypothetical protein
MHVTLGALQAALDRHRGKLKMIESEGTLNHRTPAPMQPSSNGEVTLSTKVLDHRPPARFGNDNGLVESDSDVVMS